MTLCKSFRSSEGWANACLHRCTARSASPLPSGLLAELSSCAMLEATHQSFIAWFAAANCGPPSLVIQYGGPQYASTNSCKHSMICFVFVPLSWYTLTKPDALSTITRKLTFLPLHRTFWARSVESQSMEFRFSIGIFSPEARA